jgi:nitrile hydratase accessory protein
MPHYEEIRLAPDLLPPMANGEVVFDAPWQGRVFGMAIALSEAGVFAWSEFQERLIEVVGSWDARADGTQAYPYYELFARALSDLLALKGVVTDRALADRIDELAARPHGHDHG